ncbi:DUF7535 family protein [Halogeometricum limi]|uniref:Uncharacterized protein n=1 Tax=Halogeometricum limi TaxID=555875 RepID=A0A1I6FZJ5_9EURY|nr:hypothetical protein [Halogeometricum limi]SFR35316.1 hypothetical protein SAMN04488124_0598 [Halogeometricum limi]
MATDESPSALTRAYRTVTPGYRSHPDAEMNSIGWAMFLGLLALLLPLLPFIIVTWVVSKIVEFFAAQTRNTDE